MLNVCSCEYDDKFLNDMIKGNQEIMDTIGNGFAGDVSPWLKFLDRKKMEVVDRVLGAFLGKIKQEFADHKKTLDPSEFTNMISIANRDKYMYLLHTCTRAFVYPLHEVYLPKKFMFVRFRLSSRFD